MKHILFNLLRACCCVIFCTTMSIAETYTVSNTNDSGPGSFREAITQVASNANGPHTIDVNLPDGTIIDITSHDVTDGNNGPLQAFVNIKNTTINGSGVVLRMIGNQGRFFLMDGDVTINDINFDGGSALVTGGAIISRNSNNQMTRCLMINAFAGTIQDGSGGALRIFNYSTLSLTDCTIRDCSAVRGAAVWVQEFGTLNLTNSTISNNSALSPMYGLVATPSSVFLQGSINMENSIIANSLPDGSIDLHDEGNTILTNINSLVENYVCEAGATCENTDFAFVGDPGLVPTDSSDPYFVFTPAPDSPIVNNDIGTRFEPGEEIVQQAEIPTMGEWALICLSLLLLIFAVQMISQKESITALRG